MHKGRQYPYFPDYWATEAWFWPGFAPWKLTASNNTLASGPWNRLGLITDVVSGAGFCVPDCTQISYLFDLPPTSAADTLLVSLEMVVDNGVRYARWKAVLKTGSSIDAEAWLYQQFPQTIVFAGAPPGWNIYNYILPTPPFLNLVCEPATYTQGGSPW